MATQYLLRLTLSEYREFSDRGTWSVPPATRGYFRYCRVAAEDDLFVYVRGLKRYAGIWNVSFAQRLPGGCMWRIAPSLALDLEKAVRHTTLPGYPAFGLRSGPVGIRELDDLASHVLREAVEAATLSNVVEPITPQELRQAQASRPAPRPYTIRPLSSVQPLPKEQATALLRRALRGLDPDEFRLAYEEAKRKRSEASQW